jgi:uncharacterized membrane protein
MIAVSMRPTPNGRGDDAVDYLAPVTKVIDKTEELLGHSPHPAVVTFPIGAWAVSNICDGLALATGDDTYDEAARLSMGIGLIGAAVAVATGIRDYSFIPKERPSHDVATGHGLGNALVGTLFVTSYVLRERDHEAGRPTGLAARALGLVGGGLALYTAWLGGKLVEENGEGVKPVMERMSEGEPGSFGRDDDRGRGRLAPESPLGAHRD